MEQATQSQRTVHSDEEDTIENINTTTPPFASSVFLPPGETVDNLSMVGVSEDSQLGWKCFFAARRNGGQSVNKQRISTREHSLAYKGRT